MSRNSRQNTYIMTNDKVMDFLTKMISNRGNDLLSLSEQNPVMLVFLRHFGCVFCQQCLEDIAAIQQRILQKKIELVFVHMAASELADTFIKSYNIKNAQHISDKDGHFYNFFGLEQGSLSQLYGLNSFIRGMNLTFKGYKVQLDKKLGNAKQMPGIFIIFKGAVIKKFIHKSPSDRPDYLGFVNDISVTV